MDPKSYFMRAADVMLKKYGDPTPLGMSPAPMAGFKLLCAVDHMFREVQSLESGIDLVRFRFVPSAGQDILEMEAQKSKQAAGFWISIAEFKQDTRAWLSNILSHCNDVIAPLVEDDRLNAVTLAFASVRDPRFSDAWYHCHTEDIKPRVELLLTPEGCLTLHAMQMSDEMTERTHPPAQQVSAPKPRL